MPRRLISIIPLISLFFMLVATAAPLPIPKPPATGARAFIIQDFHSGRIVAEEASDQPVEPASITKLMTAYAVFRELSSGNIALGDMVTISENAWSQNPLFEGSSLMWIEPGKDVSIADLQRGIIISSGNDATVAVAEHLDLDVLGVGDVLLDEHRVVAEGGARLGLGAFQPVRRRVLGQQGGHMLADMADSQRIKKTGKRD